MSRSHSPLFRTLKLILHTSTVIYYKCRKVTKPTVIHNEYRERPLFIPGILMRIYEVGKIVIFKFRTTVRLCRKSFTLKIVC